MFQEKELPAPASMGEPAGDVPMVAPAPSLSVNFSRWKSHLREKPGELSPNQDSSSSKWKVQLPGV